MYATVDDVFEATGHSTDAAKISMAQAICEIVSGRTEVMVTKPDDVEWMKYATAMQVVYIAQNTESVYEQANVESLRQGDNTVVFGDKVYAVAPLAVEAMKNLSWRRSRSVKTGRQFGPVVLPSWETD